MMTAEGGSVGGRSLAVLREDRADLEILRPDLLRVARVRDRHRHLVLQEMSVVDRHTHRHIAHVGRYFECDGSHLDFLGLLAFGSCFGSCHGVTSGKGWSDFTLKYP